MKNIKYIIAAVCAVLFVACQDKGEWDVPAVTVSQYGNNSIVEHNVISNKALLDKYTSVISGNSMEQITEDIQLKGRVTANDVEGNFYKKITIEDEPANADDVRAITISIDESGLWGYLPEGTEILINLKDLWIGGYGKQAQLGTPYTSSSGAVSVGRMSKFVWKDHFRILPTPIKAVEPIEFDTDKFKGDPDKYAARLVKFSNAAFKGADGKATLKSGPEAKLKGYFQTWLEDETKYGKDIVFFTSGDYAKFSTFVLPYDASAKKAIPCDIVGVASRYTTNSSTTWQISIRKAADIKVLK